MVERLLADWSVRVWYEFLVAGDLRNERFEVSCEKKASAQKGRNVRSALIDHTVAGDEVKRLFYLQHEYAFSSFPPLHVLLEKFTS